MELRGRRRVHKQFGTRSRFYLLTERRAHISVLAARRPLPAIKASTRHPQLTDNANQLSPGEDGTYLMTLRDRPEISSMYAAPVLKRAVTLTSDAIVLTIASPFFAIWWIVRAVRRRR